MNIPPNTSAALLNTVIADAIPHVPSIAKGTANNNNAKSSSETPVRGICLRLLPSRGAAILSFHSTHHVHSALESLQEFISIYRRGDENTVTANSNSSTSGGRVDAGCWAVRRVGRAWLIRVSFISFLFFDDFRGAVVGRPCRADPGPRARGGASLLLFSALFACPRVDVVRCCFPRDR